MFILVNTAELTLHHLPGHVDGLQVSHFCFPVVLLSPLQHTPDQESSGVAGIIVHFHPEKLKYRIK